MVMGPGRGGIFDTLLTLVRRGLGGTAAGGRQYISWIHHDDFYAALRFLIAHEELDGAVNLAAPEPLPNAEFMRALRGAWGARIGLPATAWMLAIGALFMGTETELILKSRASCPGGCSKPGSRSSTRGGPRPHARWSPSTDAEAGRAADPRAAGSLESGT
jgi:NAD dependent epimerase/dehydratase family enzyme